MCITLHTVMLVFIPQPQSRCPLAATFSHPTDYITLSKTFMECICTVIDRQCIT